MALKPCKECHQEVSTSAKVCPHCGRKNPRQGKISFAIDSFAKWLFKVGLLLTILGLLILLLI